MRDKPSDRLCEKCGDPYATYVLRPCQGENCIDCALFGVSESHWEMERDVSEQVSYQCPHGTSYDEHCLTCGNRVGGWGVGAAGFGELCGCEGHTTKG